MSASWETALDVFAARLDEQRAALDAGHPDTVVPFAPPPSIGELPPDLLERARHLLQDATELQAQLEATLAVTAREVQAIRRVVRSAPASSPVYVDRPL